MRILFAFMVFAAIFAVSPPPADAQNKPAVKTEAAKTQDTKQKRATSPAQEAMRDRQRACAAEWKTVKAGKTASFASTITTTWPKF